MKFWFYLVLLSTSLLSGFKAHTQKLPTLGMVESISRDSLLYASGFRLLGESVGKMLSPALSEAEFAANLQMIKQTRCKLYLCNILFPSSIKITGPAVDEKRIVGYLDTVFARAKKQRFLWLFWVAEAPGGCRKATISNKLKMSLHNCAEKWQR